MLSSPFRQSVCASCRLHQSIATKRLSRCRKSTLNKQNIGRTFQTSGIRTVKRTETHSQIQQDDGLYKPSEVLNEKIKVDEPFLQRTTDNIDENSSSAQDAKSLKDAVVNARKRYGDRLPDGLLSVEQGRVYEMLYGRPLKMVEDLDAENGDHELQEGRDNGTGILRSREGEWEEVAYEGEDDLEEAHDLELAQGDDARLALDMEAAMADEHEEIGDDSLDVGDGYQRAHPLTVSNRFATDPTTIQLPKNTLVDPIASMISTISSTHLTEAAHRIFGGVGLPDSTATPLHGKTLQQKAIPLEASQMRMSEIEADTYLTVLMPATYASIMSVLVETRKRLGTNWAESLVRKAETGKLRILDAGGAGVGILAVRDVLRAEWERMHEATGAEHSSLSLAEADGRVGGTGLSPPLGEATVLTASDTLRRRASRLLENTTFIPRLPDYVHTESAKLSGKFDIIIAPHTIWPLREQWRRKTHVENLWSLLNADGGVLCMLEKGVARGFEAIAAARDLLLKSRIPADKEGTMISTGESSGVEWETPEARQKESGMIIAPCTNHSACPMYSGDKTGTIKGRKEICHFGQRYIRPPFLQKILGARDKNFEDVKFAYLSVMRGRDLRSDQVEDSVFSSEPKVLQGEDATLAALKGYEKLDPSTSPLPSSLSLPRAILPTLKRRGHVIIDLCTPSANIERWTVTRAFSKQAFRDARKSTWGDLWALGAKVRVLKTVRLGKHARREDQKPKLSKKVRKEKRRVKERKAGKQGRLLSDE